MKALKKAFVIGAVAAFAFGTAYAQEDWDDSGFESFDSFDDAGSTGGASSGFKLGADARLDARYYVDANHNDVIDVPAKALPKVVFDVGYEGSSTEFDVKVNLNEDTVTNHQMDILDELTAKMFIGDWVFSAGKMRVVWGKGDKVHVLDNFNANDYSNFLLPDYLDRRIAEYMFNVTYNAPCGISVEGIYTPVMTGERYASKGAWKPGKVSKLEDTVKQVEGAKMLEASGVSLPNNVNGSVNKAFLNQLTSSSKLSADDLYPNTYDLDYGQFGLRVTGAVGTVNLGASYYNGRMKQVSVDYGDYVSSMEAHGAALGTAWLGTNAQSLISSGYTMAQIQQMAATFGKNNTYSTANPKLNYDKVQVFGLEAETVVGPFGLRAEAGYNMTHDTAGTAKYIHNNSVSYLAGFDVNLPIHNVALNVQGYGTFILNADSIRNETRSELNADYDPTGCYTNNKLVVQLSDTFMYEKLKAEMTFIYGFERVDFIFMPKLTWKIRDSWELIGQGLVIVCKDSKSEFYDWRNNGLVQLGVHYSF